MATLENTPDSLPCRHCGHPVRPGMIRCRECGGLLTEVADDFTLGGNVSMKAAEPTCARCGTPLESGVTECAACASALLDELMNGPGAEAPLPEPPPFAAPQWPSSAGAELRARNTPLPMTRNTSSAAIAAPPLEPAVEEPADELEAAVAAETAEATARTRAGGPVAPKRANTPPPANRTAKRPERTLPPNGAGKPPAGVLAAGAPVARAPQPAAEPSDAAAPAVETSAACSALVASLVAADAELKCEIAGALGKLRDDQATGALERLMVDTDIRVRRAAATALIQLGHPKGEALLDIAERKPAAVTLAAARPPAPKPRKNYGGGGGGGIDGDTLKKVGAAVLAVAVAVGGIWWWMSPGSTPTRGRARKAKSAATKKAAVSLKKTPVNQGD
jgi:hypothetical protein